MDLMSTLFDAHILIVDDEPANVKLLEKLLTREGYRHIQTTSDSREVESLCRRTRFDAILLDIRMPHLDGYAVMDLLKREFFHDYLPVLVLTAQTDRETRLQSLTHGAKDFLTKPFDQLEVLTRIKNLLEVRLLYNQLARHNQQLEALVHQRTEELYNTRYEVIKRLGLAAEYRDNETGNHIIRMSQYAYLLARALGLPESTAEIIKNAAPMHDIGKIGIPDRILLKPGKLDPDEWQIMMTHVTIGANILSGSDSELMLTAKRIALHHHEKWDGSGYPNGLRGEEISIEGRICALADVFDALVSERPYKTAWSLEDALAWIDAQSGKHFDPQLIPRFRDILPEVQRIMIEYADIPDVWAARANIRL